MPACPTCFGEGGHDFRDLNTYLGEHLTDAQLAAMPDVPDYVECEECEGTGVVSEERAADLAAAARAFMDQVIAKHRNEELGRELRRLS